MHLPWHRDIHRTQLPRPTRTSRNLRGPKSVMPRCCPTISSQRPSSRSSAIRSIFLLCPVRSIPSSPCPSRVHGEIRHVMSGQSRCGRIRAGVHDRRALNNDKKMRILFFGTDAVAVRTLEMLHESMRGAGKYPGLVHSLGVVCPSDRLRAPGRLCPVSARRVASVSRWGAEVPRTPICTPQVATKVFAARSGLPTIEIPSEL